MRWTAALCGSLVAGCMFHRPGSLPEPAADPAPLSKAAPPVEIPEAPPPARSPYGTVAVKTRVAGSVEPVPAQVTLVGHGQVPKAETPAAPPAPKQPLVAALESALEKHPDEVGRVLSKYDQNDRELLRALFRLAAGIDKKELERLSADEAAGTLEQLRVLTARVRQRAPLSLEKVCFCRSIEGFGQYEARPVDYKFRGGRQGLPGERMQVYVEVRNFATAAKQTGYETRLCPTLSILDESRQEVAAMTPEPAGDVSQTPRQDYYLNFQFHVPAKLKPGLYTLMVSVKDVTGEGEARVAKRSLDFRVREAGGRP